MRLLIPIFFLCFSFAMADESSENDVENFPPRVAWVPIVQRKNVTASMIGKALQEGSEEKLARIGKMLEKSYDKINLDVAEGHHRIQELELKAVINAVPYRFSLSVLPLIFLRIF